MCACKDSASRVGSFLAECSQGPKKLTLFGFWDFIGLEGFPALSAHQSIGEVSQLQGCRPDQFMLHPLELFMWHMFVSLLASQATEDQSHLASFTFA